MNELRSRPIEPVEQQTGLEPGSLPIIFIWPLSLNPWLNAQEHGSSCSHCVCLTNSLMQIKHEAGTSSTPSSCTVKNFLSRFSGLLDLFSPSLQATCPLLVPGRG